VTGPPADEGPRVEGDVSRAYDLLPTGLHGIVLKPGDLIRSARDYASAYPSLLASFEENREEIEAELDPGLTRRYERTHRPPPPESVPGLAGLFFRYHTAMPGGYCYPPPAPLEGSTRQVDWAESIRPRLYPAIRRLALARANDPAIPEEDQDRYRAALLWIGGQRAAAFWIDVRDDTVSRILELALEQTRSGTRATGPSRRRGAEPGRSAGSPPGRFDGAPGLPIETSTSRKAMSANRKSTPMTTAPTDHDRSPAPDRRHTHSPENGARPMSESRPSSDRDRVAAAAEQYRLRQVEERLETLHAVEADDEKARAEAMAEPSAETHGVTAKVRASDVLKDHPIAKTLDTETQLALVCEYLDLGDDLEGMSLSTFIDAYFTADDEVEARADALNRSDVEADAAAEDEDDATESDSNEKAPAPDADGEPRPASLIGLRVVYRFPGGNALANGVGVTRDSGGTVAFTDVEGEEWSNVDRDKVFPIDPKNYHVIHIMKREAREIEGWLSGKVAANQAEGEVLRNFKIEFGEFRETIILAVVNGKRVYVDRFVQLPEGGFEDDQKPTTRLFGEHCFRVHGVDHVVKVVTP
jgi:hypothetical protein